MENTSAEKQAYFAGFLTLPLTVAFIAPMAILRAFVFSKLWNWYFVGFFGAHRLPMVYAYGIALTVSFLTLQVSTKNDDPPSVRPFIILIVRPFSVLFFGWIGTLFF